MVVTTPPIPQQEPAGGDPPAARRIDWFNIGAVACASTVTITITITTGDLVGGLSAGAFVLNLAKMLRS